MLKMASESFIHTLLLFLGLFPCDRAMLRLSLPPFTLLISIFFLKKIELKKQN